jgi:hypothetical protein
MVDTAPARTEPTAVAGPALRLFTVDEYDRMVEAGILHEDDRLELLEGKIIQLAAMGSRHAACILRLNEFLLLKLSVERTPPFKSRFDFRYDPNLSPISCSCDSGPTAMQTRFPDRRTYCC